MKNLIMIALVTVSTAWGCKQSSNEYVDLNTGEKVVVEKDSASGYMINTETKKPVYLYVDVDKRDTFYGRTGVLVNNKIEHNGSGKYTYLADNEYTYDNGKYIIKAEQNEVKLPEGELKIKGDDYKKKVDEEGNVKIKDGDKKIKISKDGDVKIKNN